MARKKIQTGKGLKLVHESYQHLFDISQDLIWQCDLEGRYTYLNPAWEHTFKYKRSEMLGHKFSEFQTPEQSIKDNAVFRDLLNGKLVKNLETVHIGKAGNEINLVFNAMPILDEKGNVIGTGGSAHNITERKRMEASLQESRDLLQEAQEFSHIGHWNWDVRKSELVWSREIFRIFGVDPDTFEVSAESFDKTIHPEDFPNFENERQKMLDSRKDLSIEHRIILPDGEIRHVHERAHVVRDQDGKVLRVFGTVQDITERRQMEEQLLQAEKMQAIGTLAGGVAHDFNNQLSIILNFTELARKEVEESSTAALFLNNIITSTLRSADLTKKLLAFAQKGKYVVTLVDINNIISDVVGILMHSIDKRITIRQHLNANPATVSGDASQLQNAVLNVALNAIDAMPQGGELLFTSDKVILDKNFLAYGGHSAKPGKYLCICISDNGTGMEPEVQKHIFEPFFTTKPLGKGIGMGLASVYGTIQNHSGAVAVESLPGKGTTLKLYMPLVGKENSNEKKHVPTAREDSRHILVVDDEEMMLEVLKAALPREGFEVTVSGSGKEALKTFTNAWKTIDMVILDMIMPDMDGADTFRAMKIINPEVKVLLLSGFSITEGAKAIIREGALGFIQKPVMIRELIQFISEKLPKRPA